eukprot:TRINITY_DN69186_c0_g1_i1.p1 TRINITY_DN69186_c0_g1~~TRINITY_DN69186_c0_g1_i1.p1  ORF type:complete len:139 (-),score=5.38 TRINITY_DN69186_c0_g1_i1:88-504(-)
MDPGADEYEATNRHCRVQKHRYVGCAIVTVPSMAVRGAVISHCSRNEQDQPVIRFGAITATVAVHVDRTTGQEVPQALFVGWGSGIEKRTPVAADLIAAVFSALIETAMLESPLSFFAPQAIELPPCRFTRVSSGSYQ